MFDLFATIQNTLDTAIENVPCYHDHFITEQTPFPCISYTINSMANDKVGDTMVYDNASLTVKYWTKGGLADLVAGDKAIDAALREKGYRRTGGNTLYIEGGIICGVLNYSCKLKEDIIQ